MDSEFGAEDITTSMASPSASSASPSVAASSWSPTPPPHKDVRAGFHVGYVVRQGAYGNGLFAAHAIPSGTLLWKYRRGARGDASANVLAVRTESEARARLQELTQEERVYWMDHVYMFDGVLNEILDDGKLWNHSETPCTGLPPPGEEYDFESSYAIRDIAEGEELLDDYGLYEYPEWYNKLCAEFGCTRDFVCIKPPPVRLDGGAVKEGAVTSPDKEAMAS